MAIKSDPVVSVVSLLFLLFHAAVMSPSARFAAFVNLKLGLMRPE